MNKDVRAAIERLAIDDDDGLDSLVQKLREGSLRDSKALVEMLRSDDKNTARKAARVLGGLGSIAVDPLLDSIDDRLPEDKVGQLDNVLTVQLENRSRIVAILNDMLQDKRVLEYPELPPEVEEEPPPRRVCDEAYLMMRKLLALDENEGAFIESSYFFLEMLFDERDAEIERVQKTKKWISLVEQMENEAEY